jgi:hypothetical protein
MEKNQLIATLQQIKEIIDQALKDSAQQPTQKKKAPRTTTQPAAVPLSK